MPVRQVSLSGGRALLTQRTTEGSEELFMHGHSAIEGLQWACHESIGRRGQRKAL